MFDLLNQATALRFRGHVNHIAHHVHFPAVVQTAQTAIFIAAINQRRFAVRAILVHHTDTAQGVSEHHQIFAQNSGLDGRAIGLRNFFHQADGQPLTAHELTHRRIALDAAQQFIVFRSDHVFKKLAQLFLEP